MHFWMKLYGRPVGSRIRAHRFVRATFNEELDMAKRLGSRVFWSSLVATALVLAPLVALAQAPPPPAPAPPPAQAPPPPPPPAEPIQVGPPGPPPPTTPVPTSFPAK